MKRRAVIDEGIGETRAAIYEGGSAVEAYVRRWSDRDRARHGDIFIGQISKIDKSLGGAFVDLGFGSPGLLKFTHMNSVPSHSAPRLTEGQWIKAEVKREASADKGPVLSFIDLPAPSKSALKAGPVKQNDLKAFLRARFGPNLEIETAPINFIEEAIEPVIALPGGGDIAIERTRALIAIDVDKGRAHSGFDVSMASIPIIAKQLRLRALGGLVVIDFPNIRQPKQREQIYDAMAKAVEPDPAQIKLALLSRFGLLQMTRSALMMSLDETLLGAPGDGGGRDGSVETQALSALRRLEREAKAHPGAQLELGTPDPTYTWLKDDKIGWKDAMESRIGARFVLKQAEKPYVKGDR